jgi:predicted PurR-regulated permease PerM
LDQRTDVTLNNPAQGEQADPQLAKAQAAWGQLGLKLRSITPSQLFRFLLALAVVVCLVWLTLSLLPILVPFEIGIVLAYVTLPLVDQLNRIMPRPLAVGLVMLAEFVLVFGFVAALVPVLINELGSVISTLPSQDQRQQFFGDLLTQMKSVLPQGAQDFVRGTVQQSAQDFQKNAPAYIGNLLGFIAAAVLGVVGTISFALSLLVLPTWLFSVLRDRNHTVRFVNGLIPESWRADFWAPLRIADRTLGFYLRGLFVQAIAVAIGAYLGTQILQALGYGPFRYPILLAMLIGFTQLLPTFGPYIGYVLGGLTGLTRSPEDALAVVIMLIVVQILNSRLVASRIQNKVVDLHPAVLAVLLVAGSQFGLIGVLLAAPLGVMLRDLYRYVNGRLSDPPLPAGLLPGPAGSVAASAGTQQTVPGATQLRVPQGAGVPYRSTTPSPTRVQRRV